VRDCYYDRKKKSSSRLSGGCAIAITTGKKSSSRLYGGCAIAITTGKKKVLVVCLAVGRSILRPEKKVQVICLAGARLLLQAENKSSRCLSGGCAIAITTGKKMFKLSVCRVHRDYYYFYHRSDLREIIRFLGKIECIKFECNEFVLVLFKIDLINFEHPIIISSI
jgi:hypothetical protein